MLVSAEIGIGLTAAVVIGNLAVSVALIRCHFYTPLQKLAQGAIVWFVPILGAVGIWAFLRAQYKWKNMTLAPFRSQPKKELQ